MTTPQGQVPEALRSANIIRDWCTDCRIPLPSDDECARLVAALTQPAEPQGEVNWVGLSSHHLLQPAQVSAVESNTAYAELPEPDVRRLAIESGLIRKADGLRPTTWGRILRFAQSIQALRASHGQAPAGATPELCPYCNGSGDTVVMDSAGPDAQEVPANCPHCKGAGLLADAYQGVVELLTKKEREYLACCAKLYVQPRTPPTAQAAPAVTQDGVPSNVELRGLWHGAGGSFHGQAPAGAAQQPAATVIKKGADRQWMSERLGHLPDGIYSLYLAPTAQAAPAAEPVPLGAVDDAEIDRLAGLFIRFDGDCVYGFKEFAEAIIDAARAQPAKAPAAGAVAGPVSAITASIMRDDGGEQPAFCLMVAYRSENDATAALRCLNIAATPTPAPAAQADSGPAAAVERVVHLRASREKRIYVAGPMTGLPEYNFPAFNAAAAALRAEGWHVENPAEHGHVEGAGWDDYLRYDLSRVATCGAVYLLPGWPKSKGATLEVHVAGVLGLQFVLADGAEPIPADSGVQEDAARYRWLRNESWAGYNSGNGTPKVYTIDGAGNRRMQLAEDAMDEAVDAALAAKGEKQ